jgi:hypothetical protein
VRPLLPSPAPALVFAALALVAACAQPAPQIIYVLPGSAPTSSGVRELPPEPEAEEAPYKDHILIDQRSPRRALESFVRAYELDRYDLLIQFIPDDSRGEGAEELTEAKLRASWQGPMRADVQASFAAIRQALLDRTDIEVDGGRASMAFGAGGAVKLVRERDSWKVADF